MFHMHTRKDHSFKLAGRLNRRRGGSVMEMALTLGVLFYMSYGLIEFGYYFYVKNTMEGAAREGCRAGIVTGATISNCNTAVETQLQAAGLVPNGTSATAGSSSYSIGNYTVTYQDNGTTITSLSSAVAGDTITVQITATWGTVGAGFRPGAFIGSSKTITTASTMRKEG